MNEIKFDTTFRINTMHSHYDCIEIRKSKPQLRTSIETNKERLMNTFTLFNKLHQTNVQ